MTVPLPPAPPPGEPIEARLRRGLGARSIVLVGLMGAGKSTVGRRLAGRLGLMFKDADHEIEAAAKLTIADIFSIYGEASFREGEERVIARLLREGPMVLATGGGAFMREATRARIAEGAISVWLKADLDVLMRRVRKRNTRPLLQTEDPEATMRTLMEVRHPVYAGMAIAACGIPVSTRSWLGLLTVFLLFLPALVYRARLEEEALQERFGAVWEEYVLRTGFFLPRLPQGESHGKA